jgi:hypothetical protein
MRQREGEIMEQMTYDEMDAQHRRLCDAMEDVRPRCANCVYKDEHSIGGCFGKWMYDVLARCRDVDLSLEEEF